MTLISDIVSIDAYIAQKFPTAATFRQTAPLKAAPNTFAIRFQNNVSATETATSWRIEREYQVVYYGGAKAVDTLAVMDALSTALYSDKVIAKIRVESFAYSQPFKAADSDNYVCIGILRAVTREMRSMTEYEATDKILHVNVRYQPE